MKCKICGKDLKYSKTGYCRKHAPQAPEHRAKNSAGVKKMHEEGRARVFQDADRTSARTSQQKNAHATFLENSDKYYSGATLKYHLIVSGREEKCEICGITNWLDKPIALEVDHIDGNSSNNSLSNLRFLCPNCHAQTDTWRGRNINKGRQKVSNEDLQEALRTHSSIGAALRHVGLAPKGGNYSRAYKLLSYIKSEEK